VPYLLFLFLLLCKGVSLAQFRSLYTEEGWMHPGMSCIPIPIGERGIYRITAGELLRKGFPIPQVGEPVNLGLYQLGERVPFYLHYEADTLVYMEFYGEGDEGKADRILVEHPEKPRLNPHQGLLSDSTWYFLTTQLEAGSGWRVDRLQPPFVRRWEPALLERVYWVSYRDRHHKVFHKLGGVDWVDSEFGDEGFGSEWYNTLITECTLPGLPAGSNGGSEGLGNFAVLKIHLMANDLDGEHAFRFLFNGRQVGGDAFTGASIKNYSWAIPADWVREHNAVMVKATNGEYDKFSLGEVSIAYRAEALHPSGGTFGIGTFESGSNPSITTSWRTRNLVVWNQKEPGPLYTRTDASGRFFLPPALDSANYFAVPVEAVHTLYLGAQVFTAGELPPPRTDYLIITHPILAAWEKGENPIAAYAAYRESPAGGSLKPWVAWISDLEKQYAFGIPGHPLAIRSYVQHLLQAGYGLKALFLIGKGREYRDRFQMVSAPGRAGPDLPSLLPTWGYPGSDALLVSDMATGQPGIPFGRLSAVSPSEVAGYMVKVRNFENPTFGNSRDAEAAKKVIFLGGGTFPPERQYIREILTRYRQNLESGSWSPMVFPLFKENDAPIFTPYSRQYFDLVNAGAALILFFGHSTAGTFDFNIDNPDLYRSPGTLPLFLSLGCYAGNHFTAFRSQGERFVLHSYGGAIAFAATRGVGFLHLLSEMGQVVLEGVGGGDPFPSWGQVIYRAIRVLQGREQAVLRAMAQQLTFQGDPMVRLPLPDRPLPDFSLPQVYLQAGEADSFLLTWKIRHLGREPVASIRVGVVWQGIASVPLFDEDVVPEGDSILLRLPLPAERDGPSQRLHLTYRAMRWVGIAGDMLSEDIDHRYIHEDGFPGFPFPQDALRIYPLDPPDFAHARVDTSFVLLRTGPTFPVESVTVEWQREGRIEVPGSIEDPFPKTGEPLYQRITFLEGFAQGQGTFPFRPQPGEVYYWRAYPEEADKNQWENFPFSSFTWSEFAGNNLSLSTKRQLASGRQEGMHLLSGEAGQVKWQFNRIFHTLIIRNKANRTEDPPQFRFNGQPIGSPWPWLVPASVQVMVWDTVEASWMKNPPGGLYASQSNGSAMNAWVFDTRHLAGRQGLMAFLAGGIPEGAYVSLYTAQDSPGADYGPKDWEMDSLLSGTHLFASLERLGAKRVRELKTLGSVPYILHFVQGRGVLEEAIGSSPHDIIHAQAYPATLWHTGTYKSPRFGPGYDWKTIALTFTREVTAEDSLWVSLSGYNPDQVVAFPIFLKPTGSKTVTWDFPSAGISASSRDKVDLPYMQVHLRTTDRNARRPLGLQILEAAYRPLPELSAILLPFPAEDFSPGTEMLTASWRLEQAGFETDDSLRLRCSLRQGDMILWQDSARFEPMKVGEVRETTWKTGIPPVSGEFDFYWEWGIPGPDAFPANNCGIERGLTFAGPIPATFQIRADGENLSDGVYVSQRPEISIEVQYPANAEDGKPGYPLFMGSSKDLDSSELQAALLLPNGLEKPLVWSFERVSMERSVERHKGVLKMHWKPFFEAEGAYQLKVRFRESSERRSFQVHGPQRLSRVLNYPNPFNQHTRFFYTLSPGPDMDQYRIRIFTLEGHHVRTLDSKDLGKLRMGSHLTDGGWDGLDQYGEALGNGIYLYQVEWGHRLLRGKLALIHP